MTTSVPTKKLAAIILCGGGSVRMGFDKSQLPMVGGETFLDHIVATLKPVVEAVIVVQNQDRPAPRDRDAICVVDRKPNLGPMEGIASGLAALPEPIEAAFVTSCDVPLIQPAVVDRLREELGGHDGVAPVDGKRFYGLTAIYRKSVLSTLDDMIDQGILKVAELVKHLKIRQVSLDLIREVDPGLESLTNVNSYEDYVNLAKQVGFSVSAELAERLNR